MDDVAARRPRRGLRRFATLLLAAARFVWAADRRRFLISLAPPLVTAVTTAWTLLLTRDLIAAVLTRSPSGEAAQIVPPLVGMVVAGTISTLANVFNTQQQQVLNEVVGRQMQLRLVGVVSATEMARFETPEFQDRLRREPGKNIPSHWT